MDRPYAVWLAFLVFGGALGLFLKPRTIGITVGIFVVFCFVGIMVSGVMHAEAAVWVFGIALMALPFLGLIIYLGARCSNFVLGA